MVDPNRGGQATTAKTWKRKIYLITAAAEPMNTDSLDAITARIKKDDVSLRVIGLDFDDPDFGVQEPDKDPIKRQNEEWWHNWLADLPNALVATARHALEQAILPSVQLKGSAPYKTTLTFGDPSRDSPDVLAIPVRMLKLTSHVLPMSRKTVSKLAEQTQSGRDELQRSQQIAIAFLQQGPTPTPHLPETDMSEQKTENSYAVDTRRVYFLADVAKEIGTDNATPLPAGAEEQFSKAYKLGASLIPVSSAEFEWESSAGLEILQWVREDTFKRHFLLGETSAVFAEPTNLKSQVQLSSLVQAMRNQRKLAVVRFVRKDNADPKLGVLYPVTRDSGDVHVGDADYLQYAEVPFSEDIKRFPFPSLTRVVFADGTEMDTHRSLPDKEQCNAMEALVDSMDLMHLFKDEDGHYNEWFHTIDSFNPGIHRMREAVAYRVLHPDSTDLPQPHWEVDKFIKRPQEIVEASQPLADRCRELFHIRYMPDRAMQKARFKRERDEEEKKRRMVERYKSDRELDLAAAQGQTTQGTVEGESSAANPAEGSPDSAAKRMKDSSGQPQPVPGRLVEGDSDTEDEEEDNPMLPISRRPKQESSSQAKPSSSTLPAGAAAEQQQEEEEDSVEKRLIPNIWPSDPVGSFQQYLDNPSIDQGQLIRQLRRFIVDFVREGPGAWGKAVDCLHAGKVAAQQYDESREWNAWIRAFKARLVGEEGDDAVDAVNEDEKQALAYIRSHLTAKEQGSFWQTRCKGDTTLGLITKQEDDAKRVDTSVEEAKLFIQ